MSSDRRVEANKLADQLQANLKERLKNEKIAEREANEAREFERQQALFQEGMRKFNESRYTVSKGSDGKEHSESDWDTSNRKAKDACGAETSAYNSEWKIAMLGLVGLLSDFNRALNNSVTELVKPVGFAVQHQLLPQIWKKISSPFTNDPDVVLPVLIHEVKLDEKNVLQVNLTEKGREATGEFDEQFKLVVVDWLKDNHYIPDPVNNGQFVHQDTGKTLIRTKFEELKNDDVKGLELFLKDTSELQFQMRM